MPYRDTLIIAAFVVSLLAVPPLPLRINLVALGLALTTLALYTCPARARKGEPVPFEVRVDVDTTAIQAVLATLKQPALGQVAARALNDTARKGQVQATKSVYLLGEAPASLGSYSVLITPGLPPKGLPTLKTTRPRPL
jgi:hypothetical protein